MRTPIALVALSLALSGCGSAPKKTDAPVPLSDIDTAAWGQDIRSVEPDAVPDFPRLYDVVLKDCEASVDDLALQFTLVGANPAESRVNVKYVCPYRQAVVDQAIAQEAQVEKETTVLCNADPSTMSADEYDKYDAICQP